MFDHLMEKLILNITSADVSQTERLAEIRIRELTEIKRKVRTGPEEVEAWFEKEVSKVKDGEFTDLRPGKKWPT